MEENKETEAKETEAEGTETPGGKFPDKLAYIVSGSLLVVMLVAILLVSIWSDISPEPSKKKKTTPTPTPTAVVTKPTSTPTSTVPPVEVWIDAPEEGRERRRITAVVSIGDVMDLDAAEYVITYDTEVLEFRDADNGEIDGTSVPVDFEVDEDEGRIVITSDIRGDDGVSGSGALAEIEFMVVGDSEDVGVISFVVGSSKLLDNKGGEIPASWDGDSVTVE